MRLPAIVLLTLFLPWSSAIAETIRVSVTADRTKVNDAPWDGIVGSGVGRGAVFLGVPTSGPPDLALCVVEPSSKPICATKTENKKIFSLCQNSYDCDFEIEAPDSNMFGFIVLDLDKETHDLVDVGILLRDASYSPENIAEFKDELRKAAAQLSPAFSEGEKQRRARDLQTFELSECSGDNECRLRQSVLRVVP